MKIGEGVNEYGTPVSIHKCQACGDEYTVCPPCPTENNGGCLAPTCESYDPDRDVEGLFEGGSPGVLKLDDYRPHLTINCANIGAKEVHVLPVALVEDVVAGKKPPQILGVAVLRSILKEWLGQ